MDNIKRPATLIVIWIACFIFFHISRPMFILGLVGIILFSRMVSKKGK